MTIGTENGYAIGMEGKARGPYTYFIIASQSVGIVVIIAAKAALYITIAFGAALDWRSVGTGIGRASASTAAAAAAAVITIRKTKCCRKEQDREGTEKVEEAAGFCGKKARGAFFTI